MKVLLLSESPLELLDGEFYAVDPWVIFPLRLAQECRKMTLWAPVAHLPAGRKPVPGSWKLVPGKLIIAEHDCYHSFASYYRLLPWRFPAWKKAAEALIAEHDLVAVRHPSPMVSLVASVARRLKKPMVMLLAGDVAQSDRIVGSRGLKRWLYCCLVRFWIAEERRCCRQAVLIYAYNRALAQRHADRGKAVKFMRTPHVSLSDFRYRQDTCQGERIRLLRVSWLIPIKGLSTLLKSLRILLDRRLPVELEIAGKERENGYCRKLKDLAADLGVSDRVIFSGWKPYQEMPQVYWRSDIQVISSISEGTPRSIVEGACCGLPLVSTLAGGCADTLVDGREALLVPVEDPGALAGAVERLIRDNELRRRIIRNGYEMAVQSSFEQMGMRVLREMREACIHV